jgi:hypothetical protein
MHIDGRANRSTFVGRGDVKFVSLSMSPDGKSLAMVDARGRVAVRALDGARASSRKDQTESVVAEDIQARFVDYAPDGRYLALATDDNVLLLEPSTLRRLNDPHSQSAGSGVLFSFDGTGSRIARIARTGFQSTEPLIEIEDLDAKSWIRAACRKANRELSESEIQLYLGGRPPLASCAQAIAGANSPP